MLDHSPGDGQPVEGAGPPSDLVQNQQAVAGGVSQNIGYLGHFHHKGTLAAGQVVGGPHPGENAVADTDVRLVGGHEAAQLGHEHDQGNLAHVGGFSGHVGAGDHGQPVLAVVQIGVVCHEQIVPHHLLHHRMASVFNGNGALLVDSGLHVIAPRCHGGQGAEHVGARDGLGGLLDTHHLGGDVVPDLTEQVVLQGHQLVLGPHDDLLQLL